MTVDPSNDSGGSLRPHDVSAERSRLIESRVMPVLGLVRPVAVLTTGTALSQLITLAFSPLITRLYGPSAFGSLSVFTSAVAVTGGCATLAYAYAIALPKHVTTAHQLLRLSLRVGLLVSIAIAVVSAIAGNWFVAAFRLQAIKDTLVLLPLAVFLAAVVQSFENWHIRFGNFQTLARNSVLQSAFAGCARALGGMLGPSACMLILLSVAAQFLQAVTLVWPERAKIAGLSARSGVSPTRASAAMRAAGRRYSDFPLYRAPQLLLNFVSRSAPVLVLAAMFGAKVAGLYAIAQTVIYLPFTLVAQSFGQVLLQRLSSEIHAGGTIGNLVTRATATLAVIGAAPFGLLALLGPWLFGFVFGAEWAEAGRFAQWLTVWVFFHFINVPAVQALTVIGSQRVLLAWEVVTTSAKVGLLIAVGTLTSDATVTIAAYSVFGAIAYLVLIALGFSRAARYESDRIER